MSHPRRRPKATKLAVRAKKAGMSQALLRAIEDGSVMARDCCFQFELDK